ncbi:MAG: hypothetical protein EOO73_34205 [Myxococcales bacterium]|nr:MAG: hypothetical protein EOO73_34205 [Myxococcales bacterium]
MLLEAFPRWSDRKIAEAVGVHNETVGAVRKRLTETVTPELPSAESGEPTPDAPDPDTATVAKLSRMAGKLVAQCPEAKRVELWAAIGELFEAKQPGGG